MPNYNAVITTMVASLFGLFMVLPALLAWFNNLNIWPIQTFSLLIWSVGSFIILRRLMLNAPSERQEKIMSSIVFPTFYLPFMVSLNGGFTSIVELTFLASIEFQLSVVALSMFIWLLPQKKYKQRQPTRILSATSLFFVSNSTKLVFGALSSQGFLVTFCFQLIAVLAATLVAYYDGSTEMFYFTLFALLFHFPYWLQQKEKLSVLIFLLNSKDAIFGKVVYRSFFNIYLYFAVLTGLCIWGVSSIINVHVPVSALLLSILSTGSMLYFLLRFAAQQVCFYIGIAVLMTSLMLIRSYMDVVPWINAALVVFVALTYKFPPLHWLKVEYGFNPNKATM